MNNEKDKVDSYDFGGLKKVLIEISEYEINALWNASCTCTTMGCLCCSTCCST